MIAPSITLAAIVMVVGQSTPSDYFEIRVVDDETGRGVPLVELTTVNQIRLWTDSAGCVAFHEPGLMGREVFFHIASHGYEAAADGFGYRGKRLKVNPGGRIELPIRRINIAERLYRVTGGGIYRDSLLLGRSAPLAQPAINAKVFGSDSVQAAVFQDRIYWFWGDTNRPGYPLGNFKVPGATSQLPDRGGLNPQHGVDLDYFVDPKAFAKRTIPWKAQGPTWISGLLVLGHGEDQRMFAHYSDILGGGRSFESTEHGLVEFDVDAQQFSKVAVFPKGGPFPDGSQAMRHTDDGTEYIYFCDPFPLVRVRALPETLSDLQQYEAFTCLAPGTTNEQPQIDRDDKGRARWSWKPNAEVVTPRRQEQLIKKKLLTREEARLTLRDDSGEIIVAHRGSVRFNAFRNRWVMIFCQVGGTSHLGEIWYAEADALEGPWQQSRKIVTHDQYSFYNPTHHAWFDSQGGRMIYFEGTYTSTFSGNPSKTPRYDYNQIMYRLDLADPRLAFPSTSTPAGD